MYVYIYQYEASWLDIKIVYSCMASIDAKAIYYYVLLVMCDTPETLYLVSKYCVVMIQYGIAVHQIMSKIF